jgi:hypothetical protein
LRKPVKNWRYCSYRSNQQYFQLDELEGLKEFGFSLYLLLNTGLEINLKNSYECQKNMKVFLEIEDDIWSNFGY